MSFQEIRSLTTSLTTVFIVIFYYIFLINHYYIEFNAQNVDFSFWGTAILLMVPVLVVAQIIVQIVIHIIMAILTRGKEDLALEDERSDQKRPSEVEGYRSIEKKGIIGISGSDRKRIPETNNKSGEMVPRY